MAYFDIAFVANDRDKDSLRNDPQPSCVNGK